MTSFAEQVTALALPTDVQTITFEPPKIWWHNGIKQAKTAGSFYTRASEFANGLAEPWIPEERFDGEAGFATTSLRLAILAYRSQPMRKYKDAEGKDQTEWKLRYEKGDTIYTELLCMIEGYDGPVVWAMKGLTGQAVTGKNGILQSYINGLLKEASRVAKRGMPLWSFWLPIASKQTAGKTAYEDTGFGSFVTPPALFLPENAIDVLFVQPEGIAKGADILNEYTEWSKTKRLPQNVIEAEVVEVRALPAPNRNVPQPIEADDTY